MAKDTSCNSTLRNSGLVKQISDKIDFTTENITRDEEEHFTMLKSVNL